ncbi:MAG: hypothetical protein ACJ796_21625 [Gemmatimonadaceae bacterium]
MGRTQSRLSSFHESAPALLLPEARDEGRALGGGESYRFRIDLAAAK